MSWTLGYRPTYSWPQNIQQLSGKQVLPQAAFGKGEELLTQAWKIGGWLKDHFKEALTPTNMSSEKMTESNVLEECWLISWRS